MSDYPILKIDGDWTVDDLQTIDECDRARDVLTAAVVSIEEQLLAAKADRRDMGVPIDTDWLCRAKSALRYRKAAMQRVQEVRARLAREAKIAMNNGHDRVLLDIIKETESDAFFRGLAEAKRRRPDIFGSQ